MGSRNKEIAFPTFPIAHSLFLTPVLKNYLKMEKTRDMLWLAI